MPPLPPSSVDTALSATSEVDGVTVTVISSPALAAFVTLLSSAAIVPLPRSVATRERSARCRNDHKPSAFRFCAMAFLLSAIDNSCRKRDNIKPVLESPPPDRKERERIFRRFYCGYYRRDDAVSLTVSFINLAQDFLLTIFFPRNSNSYKPHKCWSSMSFANSSALAVDVFSPMEIPLFYFFHRSKCNFVFFRAEEISP